MTFFSSLLISAYLFEVSVCTKNSTADSRLVKALWLEHRVPAKRGWPSCGHNRTICPAFEQDRLRARASAICKRAQRIRILCWEANEKVIQTLSTVTTTRQSGANHTNLHVRWSS